MAPRKKSPLKAIVVLALIIGFATYSAHDKEPGSPAVAQAKTDETYRLVHAIGNTERIVAVGLTKRECDTRKTDHVAVAEALGIHSEALGVGSIACLPESLFRDG